MAVALLGLVMLARAEAKPRYVTCTIINVFHGYEEAVITRCQGDPAGGLKTLIADLPDYIAPVTGTKFRVTRDKTRYAPASLQPKKDDPCDDALKPEFAHAQQPKNDHPETIYRLNPEASATWTQIGQSERAENERHDQELRRLNQLRAVMLQAAGVPSTEWDRPITTEASGVVALMPKPKATATPTPKKE
jgi:hypothetical protein